MRLALILLVSVALGTAHAGILHTIVQEREVPIKSDRHNILVEWKDLEDQDLSDLVEADKKLGETKLLMDVWLDDPTFSPTYAEYCKENNKFGFIVPIKKPDGGWKQGWNHAETTIPKSLYRKPGETPWSEMNRMEIYRRGPQHPKDGVKPIKFRNIQLLKGDMPKPSVKKKDAPPPLPTRPTVPSKPPKDWEVYLPGPVPPRPVRPDHLDEMIKDHPRPHVESDQPWFNRKEIPIDSPDNPQHLRELAKAADEPSVRAASGADGSAKTALESAGNAILQKEYEQRTAALAAKNAANGIPPAQQPSPVKTEKKEPGAASGATKDAGGESVTKKVVTSSS